MTTARTATAMATAALLLAAGTACVSDGQGTPPTEAPTSAASSPTPSKTATPTAPQVAAEDASRVVRDYFATVDRLRQQPERGLRPLRLVATGGELSAQQILLKSERSKGLRQVGDTVIADLRVQAVDLSGPTQKPEQDATAQVDVCWDVSGVDLVDASGTSVVSPARPDVGWIRFTLSNPSWATDPGEGWRVSSGQDLERAPCTAS